MLNHDEKAKRTLLMTVRRALLMAAAAIEKYCNEYLKPRTLERTDRHED